MFELSDKLNRIQEIDREELLRAQEAAVIYRPMPQQIPIHTSTAHELIIRGGKRSGKSTSAALEFARRVSGQPICCIDGQPLHNPWPQSTKSDPAIYWIIGWDQKHIGQTIHRLLFQPGLFRIIKDEITGQWRAWNKADPADAARKKESVPVGPAIPPRLIVPGSWSWENLAEKQFTGLELINGARIYAFWSSAVNPKMGDPVDGIWINEDIQAAGHLKEWQDRLLDKDGWFLWDAWPKVKNLALKSLLDRAEEVADDPDPSIQAVQLIASENLYHTAAAKKRQLERMGSDEEIASRDRGELLWDELSMYDFWPASHVVRRRPGATEESAIATPRELLEHLLSHYGQFPREWTRYLSVDPSHTRTGVLSGVVPPPEWSGIKIPELLIIEWELVVRKASPAELAELLYPLMARQPYEAFIMDQQAGRQHTIGSDGRSVFELYAEAFRAHRIVSRATGSGFSPGCNKPQLRYAMVRQQMEIGDQLPGLVLVDDRTRETQREFHTYTKKTNEVKGELDELAKIVDEPANPRKHDMMASLEYLVSYLNPLFRSGQAYVPPSESVGGGSAAYRAAQALLAKQRSKDGGDYVHLGPGAAA